MARLFSKLAFLHSSFFLLPFLFHGTTICTVSLGAAWPASLAAMI
jgi:cell division protein FtsX